MEIVRSRWEELSKQLCDKPQQARRDYSITLTPPYYALTPTAKTLHKLRASESGYCSRNDLGYFSKLSRDILAMGLFRPTLQNIGGRQQLHRLLHQCEQVIDVQLFLELPTDVHNRLVTDVELLSDLSVILAFRQQN